MWTGDHALLAYGELFAVLIVCFLAALLARPERRRILRDFGIYVAAVLARAGAAIAGDLYSATTTHAALLVASRILLGIALLDIAFVIVFAVLLRRVHLEPPRLARDLTITFAYIALALYLCALYQVNVTSIITTSAVLTAVVGFALQDILGNILAGVALQFDRTVVAGDLIEVVGVQGIVRDVSWRHVIVEAEDGGLFVVPNSDFMKKEMRVRDKRTRELAQRRDIKFSIGTAYAPARVVDGVTEALVRGAIPFVAADPRPQVLVEGFGWGCVKYAARYWLLDPDKNDETDSIVRTRVFYALRRLNIPVWGAKAQAPEPEARATAIRNVSIFNALKDNELQHVAGALEYVPYTNGEPIIEQGGSVDHLFVLTRGAVEVRVTVDGVTRPVTTIAAPSFFGEMGMLTGEPRRASVVAQGDVECWALDRDGFRHILHARPEIADGISHALAERLAENAAAREGLTEEARRLRVAAEQKTLMGRIHSFFDVVEARKGA
jgi:small-conductance mechanosensitive channel/CRP-like cAMP-binding protein